MRSEEIDASNDVWGGFVLMSDGLKIICFVSESEYVCVCERERERERKKEKQR